MRDEHAVSRLVCFLLMERIHHASYTVEGWMGITFVLQHEYANSENVLCLDRFMLRITKRFLSNSDNQCRRAMYHHSPSYSYAEIIE